MANISFLRWFCCNRSGSFFSSDKFMSSYSQTAGQHKEKIKTKEKHPQLEMTEIT
jgi:hypothetical protein